MSASAEAQNDLENIEASVGDLISVSPVEKAKVQMDRSRDFGPSLMTEEAIKALEDQGCFPVGKGHPPCGETVPQPEVDEAVVFKDFLLVAFAYLWSISSAWFLRPLRYTSIILLLMASLL